MLTKTIKLNPGEFTNFTTEFYEHDLIILSGARGRGKSRPTAKHISTEFLEKDEGSKFGYMRIRNDELATFAGWCDDLHLTSITGGAHSNKLVRGRPGKGDITLLGYDTEGMQTFSRTIGKCISLESAADFKSGKYDEFKALVFEEYARLNMNPKEEKRYVFNFLETVTSIFRNRPKKIFLICNNLNSIPLLDRAVDELTGKIFLNPVKFKIFGRKGEGEDKANKFMAYLNGELYENDDFIAKIEEFITIYTNRDYIVMKHKVYPNKYYILENKRKEAIGYKEETYLRLKFFCVNSSNNEFYFQTGGLERNFSLGYTSLLAEISSFLSAHGWKFIS